MKVLILIIFSLSSVRLPTGGNEQFSHESDFLSKIPLDPHALSHSGNARIGDCSESRKRRRSNVLSLVCPCISRCRSFFISHRSFPLVNGFEAKRSIWLRTCFTTECIKNHGEIADLKHEKCEKEHGSHKCFLNFLIVYFVFLRVFLKIRIGSFLFLFSVFLDHLNIFCDTIRPRNTS